jgi:hypothetical protein
MTALLRPFVEVLEGRWVPTTLTPTTFLDGGLGSGSLRDAVLQLNADTGTDDDIIRLEAGTYALTIQNVSGRHETAGLTGDLNLTQTSHRWIIEGAGPSTIIDASQLQDRVFQIVNPGTQVVFQDLVIQGGLAQDNGADGALAGTTDALGGGIFNNGGDVTLENVVVQNSGARGGDSAVRRANGYNGFGGAIYSTGGALTLAGATITNNQASGGRGGDSSGTCAFAGADGSARGAGLYASGGSLDISDSSIANNQATGGRGGNGNLGSYCTHVLGGDGGLATGGGLYVNGSALTISTSAIASNQATGGIGGRYGGQDGYGQGGGLYNLGTLTVTSCTLSGNSATPSGRYDAAEGGGIYNSVTGTLMVSNSTLSGNSANGLYASGGGISNHGALTVSNSTLSGNSAGPYYPSGGGGINNSDTLTVSNSTLSGNSATYGGGIENGGTLTINNSTLSGNSAYLAGGGIYNAYLSTLTVSNSTLSGNSASNAGGGIDWLAGPVTLTNVTLTANRATSYGGGLYVENVSSLPPVLHNTLIAGNFRGSSGTTPDDVVGSLNSGGDDNLIGDGTGMIGLSNGVNGNLVGSAANPIDPLLGSLADNGGPTLTHALLSGSPAIDAGNNAYATDWDQRGPGFRRIVNGTIDIGAFEVQAPAASYPTRQPLPDPVPVQALGTPGGPLLGQPPDLPTPLPEPSNPDAQAGHPEPVPVPTAGGQQAPATLFGTDPGTEQPVASLGSSSASDLDALALTMLGGP